ncbi:MAG TPA: ABC transporter substrate-binding protein [Stellaceae bacterium]|nr:ABC transporter substrate-binding protein [Stellaceae bacterium]
MRRRRLIAFIGIAGIALPFAVRAQPTHPIPKIGWLKIQGRLHTPDQLQAFREGMKALGLIEGRDFVLEERYADDDEKRLPGLADDLINSGVAVIVATSQPSIAAAWRVTKSIPVIGRMVDDPVADGMAQSLARPGGNVTGIYTMTEEMTPKRLELLREAVPSMRRVGVLMRQDFPSANIAGRDWKTAEAAARQLAVELVALNVTTEAEITSAFERASKSNIDGIMTFRNPTVVTYLDLIAALSRKHRLPAIFDAREYVEAGGLMSYGPNIDKTYQQLAGFVLKLLHEIPPGELPIEEPRTFELVINKRTADDIGASLPLSLLSQADKVIE